MPDKHTALNALYELSYSEYVQRGRDLYDSPLEYFVATHKELFTDDDLKQVSENLYEACAALNKIVDSEELEENMKYYAASTPLAVLCESADNEYKANWQQTYYSSLEYFTKKYEQLFDWDEPNLLRENLRIVFVALQKLSIGQPAEQGENTSFYATNAAILGLKEFANYLSESNDQEQILRHVSLFDYLIKNYPSVFDLKSDQDFQFVFEDAIKAMVNYLNMHPNYAKFMRHVYGLDIEDPPLLGEYLKCQQQVNLFHANKERPQSGFITHEVEFSILTFSPDKYYKDRMAIIIKILNEIYDFPEENFAKVENVGADKESVVSPQEHAKKRSKSSSTTTTTTTTTDSDSIKRMRLDKYNPAQSRSPTPSITEPDAVTPNRDKRRPNPKV